MKDYEDAISQSSKQIDLKKLTEVISNDLLKEKLIIWLEENSELKEKTIKTSKATKTSKTKKTTTTSKTQKDIKIEALLDALTNELVAEIPKSMIDIEVRNNIEQTAQRFAQQGLDVKSTFTPELVKSLAESTRPQAEKNVQRNLALKALAETEKIKVEQDEIDSKMKDYEDAI